MANGLPDEFPFNRRRYSYQQPADSASSPSETEAELTELTPEEVEEVAQAANAASALAAPFAPIAAPAQPIIHREVAQSAISYRPPASPLVERRNAVRQTLIARATIRPESNYAGIGPSAAGYVSNISLKGVGFHTRRPLIIGERYSIKLEVGPMRWVTRLKIVTCQPHPGGTYDVGAEFITNELQIRAPRDIAA